MEPPSMLDQFEMHGDYATSTTSPEYNRTAEVHELLEKTIGEVQNLQKDVAYLVSAVSRFESGMAAAMDNPMLKSMLRANGVDV